MSPRAFSSPDAPEWKQAYLAAVLEKDRELIPGLIQYASAKLSARLHELWLIRPIPREEVEAIDSALYMLQALLTTLSYREEQPSGSVQLKKRRRQTNQTESC